ncbi:MAG TPA: quinoprotein relay system zinc metallohydrolase 2 [Gammaproteobacteria bacterium]|nr:quinoprotein relay system zinc metallohydrolase 2 [Gammaproteobacteria bacterium]
MNGPARGLSGVVLSLLLAVAIAVPAEPVIRLEPVAEGVHVHRGGHHSLTSPDRADIANLGVVIGTDCVAVIDTGGSVAVGRALRQAIAGLTSLPVCWVINTHVHFDHVLGNAAFADAQTVFVGHVGLAEAVAASRAFFVEHFTAELGGGKDAAAQVITPSRGVTDTLELPLGGRSLLLKAHPGAHSGQDLTVFDAATGTLFVGDLLFVERVPSLDGSLLGWLALLETLPGVGVVRVVPGHGPASVAGPHEVQRLREYLEGLRDGVRAAIAEGAVAEDAAAGIAAAEATRWVLFPEVHPRNVVRAWMELEWE